MKSSFQERKASAIQVLRDLAGGTWTDYNVHDPGITLLEHLAYAITDLEYRLGFTVPELLAGNHEDSSPGMFDMEEVLSNAPVTDLDWRKVIADIEGIRNVELRTASNPSPELYFDPSTWQMVPKPQVEDAGLEQVALSGLHELRFDVDPSEPAPSLDSLLRQIHDKYYALRAAGEDLHLACALSPAMAVLRSEIDLAPRTYVEDVMAEILSRISVYLSNPLTFKSLKSLVDSGESSDMIFQGPLLDHGFLEDAEMDARRIRSTIYLSEIVSILKGIPGVMEIREVSLKGNQFSKSSHEASPYWIIEVKDGFAAQLDIVNSIIGTRLYKNDVELTWDPVKVVSLYKEKLGSPKLMNQKGKWIQPPVVRDRDVAAYPSLQHDLPDNYGINATGLPSDASVDRQAMAQQLKAYLSLFEQVLANLYAQAGNLGRLFSFRSQDQTGYYAGDISDIPDLADLWVAGKSYAEDLPSITQSPESPHEPLRGLLSKNKILNHLLARHGDSLRNFGRTSPAIGGTDMASAVTRKMRLLQGLATDIAGRGKGPSIHPGTPNGTLETRIATKLGIDLIPQNQKGQAFYLVDRILLRPIEADYAAGKPLFWYYRYPIKEGKILGNSSEMTFTPPREPAPWQQHLSPLKVQEEICVFGAGKRNIPPQGIATVNRVDANGYPTSVEMDWKTYTQNRTVSDWNWLRTQTYRGDPWSLQVVFVFNGDVAPFNDLDFRKYVEQTILDETPAHLTAWVRWLDGEGFSLLRQYDHEWKKELSNYSRGNVACNSQPQQLIPAPKHLRLRGFRNAVIDLAFEEGATFPLDEVEVWVHKAYYPAFVVQETTLVKIISGSSIHLFIPEPECGVRYELWKIDGNDRTRTGFLETQSQDGETITDQKEGAEISVGIVLSQPTLNLGLNVFEVIAVKKRTGLTATLRTQIRVMIPLEEVGIVITDPNNKDYPLGGTDPIPLAKGGYLTVAIPNPGFGVTYQVWKIVSKVRTLIGFLPRPAFIGEAQIAKGEGRDLIVGPMDKLKDFELNERNLGSGLNEIEVLAVKDQPGNVAPAKTQFSVFVG